jgi:hypothetical protein
MTNFLSMILVKNSSVKDELNTVLISMLSVFTIVGANNLGVFAGGT